jgi:hypothetical protein
VHRFNRHYNNEFFRLIKADPASCGVAESAALAAMPECDVLPGIDVNGSQTVANADFLSQIPPEFRWASGGYYEAFGPHTEGWANQFTLVGFEPSPGTATAAMDVVQLPNAFSNIHEWLGSGWPAQLFPKCSVEGARQYARTIHGMCRVRELDDKDYYAFRVIATDALLECFGVRTSSCRMLRLGKVDGLYYETMGAPRDDAAAVVSANESTLTLHWGTHCVATWEEHPIPYYPQFASRIINRATWRDRAMVQARYQTAWPLPPPPPPPAPPPCTPCTAEERSHRIGALMRQAQCFEYGTPPTHPLDCCPFEPSSRAHAMCTEGACLGDRVDINYFAQQAMPRTAAEAKHSSWRHVNSGCHPMYGHI